MRGSHVNVPNVYVRCQWSVYCAGLLLYLIASIFLFLSLVHFSVLWVQIDCQWPGHGKKSNAYFHVHAKTWVTCTGTNFSVNLSTICATDAHKRRNTYRNCYSFVLHTHVIRSFIRVFLILLEQTCKTRLPIQVNDANCQFHWHYDEHILDMAKTIPCKTSPSRERRTEKKTKKKLLLQFSFFSLVVLIFSLFLSPFHRVIGFFLFKCAHRIFGWFFRCEITWVCW